MIIREYRRIEPGAEGLEALPEGTGAVVGSESCVHLLPAEEPLARAVDACARRGVRLVLLTPYLRDGDLRRLVALLRTIPPNADVDAAVNDWGALLVLRTLFPDLRLSLGRLLSGRKACPRIGITDRLTARGREWHGTGIFGSRAVVECLCGEMNITGVHVDSVAWGMKEVGDLLAADGNREGATPRDVYLHVPWAVVTVTDFCPWIGGVSSARIASCARPCRNGAVELREPSMGAALVQRGKERLVRTEGAVPAEGSGGAPVLSVVRSADPP